MVYADDLRRDLGALAETAIAIINFRFPEDPHLFCAKRWWKKYDNQYTEGKPSVDKLDLQKCDEDSKCKGKGKYSETHFAERSKSLGPVPGYYQFFLLKERLLLRNISDPLLL